MPLNQMLLAEMDRECPDTRKFLARVPEGNFAWKPHAKSMSLGDLAAHIANLMSWAVPTIKQDSLDLMPLNGPPLVMPKPQTRDGLLALFDQNARDARLAIADASDEHLQKPWTLMMGGETIFTLPRAAVLRQLVMNHAIHHRAQLGVYLRLNDIPVPAVYGPSADEG